MKKCSKCGKDIPDDREKCDTCGRETARTTKRTITVSATVLATAGAVYKYGPKVMASVKKVAPKIVKIGLVILTRGKIRPK